MAEKPKLDIFRVLNEIDRRNYDFFESLTPEEKKAFVPFMVTRWMSGAPDQGGLHSYYLQVTNEMVNKNLWELKDHPELVWKLMAACGAGTAKRHQWIKGPSRGSKSKIEEYIRASMPGLNSKEYEIVRAHFTEESFRELLLTQAVPEKEEKELMKLFKKEEKDAKK